jgi:hypothetical protein
VNKDILKAPVHSFSDASFGVVYKTLRSISGVAIYLHGCPISWKCRVQTVFAGSTTESEWIALSDAVEVSESVQALHEFLVGRAVQKGPLWCDNRGAVICGRKGVNNTDEIPKKTRHVALRFARVLPESERLFFVPTDLQRADGLTKSGNYKALRNIFQSGPHPAAAGGDEGLDLVPAYLTLFGCF